MFIRRSVVARCASLALLAGALACPAAATIVAITFSGPYTSLGHEPSLPTPFTTAVSGDALAFTVYADSTVAGVGNHISKNYAAGIVGWSLTIGATTYSETGSGPAGAYFPRFFVYNNHSIVGDAIEIYIRYAGFDLVAFLADHTSTALSSTAFPTSINFSSFANNPFLSPRFVVQTPQPPSPSARGVAFLTDATMVSVVPLPGPALLGALGLAPLPLIRRRR